LGDEYYMTLVTRGEVDLDERDVAEAHAKWVRGANSVEPDDDAVTYVVERLTNARFPMTLLRTVVKFL